MTDLLAPINPDIGNLGEAFQRVVDAVNTLDAGGGGLPLGDSIIEGSTNIVVLNVLGDDGDDVVSIQPPVGSGGLGSLEVNSFGGNPASVYFSSAGGVRGAPTRIVDDGFLGGIRFEGYAATGYRTGGKYYFQASEDWDDTHFGSYYALETTNLAGDTSPRIGVDEDGLFSVGTPSGLKPAQGSGTATAVAGAATLNKQNGAVTSEALTGATTYTLTLANSVVLSTSTVLVNLTNSAHSAVALTDKTVTNGQVVIAMSMASLTGTIKADFAVFN